MVTRILQLGIRDVDPDRHEEWIAIARRALSSFGSHPGTERFIVSRDLFNPDRFYVFEVWGDDEPMNELLGSQEVKEVGRLVSETVRSRSQTMWSAEQLPPLSPNQRIKGVQDGRLIVEERTS